MAKKKNNYLFLAMQFMQILLVVLVFCTLAMTAFTITGSVLGVSSTASTSLANFIKEIFDGTITNGWAITALVLMFLTFLFALTVLIKAIFNLVSKKKIKVNYLEILLLIFSVLFLIAMIIYASTLKGNMNIWGVSLANATCSISWATIITPISAFLILLTQLFVRR